MGSQSVFGEVYQGGSAEAVRFEFENPARDIMRMQVDNRGSSRVIPRCFHAKVLAGVANVKLRILDDINFRIGYVKPRAEYEAIVRLSNANGASRADAKRDMRGLAVRIKLSDHDLLAANFPVSHAGDARQFVAFAPAIAGSKLLLLPRLCFSVGPFETIRMFRNVLAASRKKTRSLALESYWKFDAQAICAFEQRMMRGRFQRSCVRKD